MGESFAYTRAIELAALLVGLFGLAGTLLMSLMERTRELGMLRAIGMSRFQMVRMILGEAALLGCVGGVIAAALGAYVSYAWVVGSLSQSLGWFIDVHIPWSSVGGTLAAGLIVGLLAGLLLARRVAGLELRAATGAEMTTSTHALALSAKVPPGPRGGFLLGSVRDLARDPLALFLRSASEYGGLVRFRFAHLHAYLVSEPAYIKHILTDNMRNYVKGVSYASLRHTLGDGLLVAEGELWRKQRRLMNPAFGRQVLLDKVPAMRECVDQTLARWEPRASSGDSIRSGPRDDAARIRRRWPA